MTFNAFADKRTVNESFEKKYRKKSNAFNEMFRKCVKRYKIFFRFKVSKFIRKNTLKHLQTDSSCI